MPYPIKRGTFRVDPTTAPQVPGGPINIQTLASTSPQFMWAISTDRVAYVDVSGKAFRAVSEIGLPGVSRVPAAAHQALLGRRFESLRELEREAVRAYGKVPMARTASGLYTLVDSDNVAYAVSQGSTVVAVGLEDTTSPEAGLEVKRTLDATKVFPPVDLGSFGEGVRIMGLALTYDGYLVLCAVNGVAVVDRNFERPAVVYMFGAGEAVSNSVSIDEKNGIYVASDKLLRKLVWTGTQLSDRESDGAWSSAYDTGRAPPTIKGGTGTGSTPTLMGFGPDDDRLVVITDGADRMKLVAFWRDAIPAPLTRHPGAVPRRIADQIEVTAGLPTNTEWVQSEQSVVVDGYGAFVVNNIVPKGHPDKVVDALALGPILEPARGCERFEWDPATDRFRSVWTRGDVSSTSMVPVVSGFSGIVAVNGYTGKDGWEVTGLDWATGETVHRTLFGFSGFGNGAYAILQFLPDGDLLFNGIAGPLRAQLD